MELKPIKTIEEWFANLSLIYKLDLYNSFPSVITKRFTGIPNCEDCKEQNECDIYQSWLNDRDCCCPLRVKERRIAEVK